MPTTVQNLPNLRAKSTESAGRSKPAPAGKNCDTTFDDVLNQARKPEPAETSHPKEVSSPSENTSTPKSARAAKQKKVDHSEAPPDPPDSAQQPEVATDSSTHAKDVIEETPVLPEISAPPPAADKEDAQDKEAPEDAAELPLAQAAAVAGALAQSEPGAANDAGTPVGGDSSSQETVEAVAQSEVKSRTTVPNRLTDPSKHTSQTGVASGTQSEAIEPGENSTEGTSAADLASFASDEDVDSGAATPPDFKSEPQIAAAQHPANPTSTRDVGAPVVDPLAEFVKPHTTAGAPPQTLGQAHAARVDAQGQFSDVNHPQIVSAVRGQLLPEGGTMHIRLDPPELGALMITVSVRDGVVDASFQTASDQATQLLSHSMTQLKHALESQGVSVDKLQVAQAPRSERGDLQQDRNNPHPEQSALDWQRHSDQQRKEMLRRMWARLGVGDPLDMVA